NLSTSTTSLPSLHDALPISPNSPIRAATPAASTPTFPPGRPHPEQPVATRHSPAPSERSEGAQQPHGNRPDLPVRDRFAMPSVRYWKISLSLSKICLSLSWSFTSDPYPF